MPVLTSNMQQANKSSTAGHSQHSIENADHGRGNRGRMKIAHKMDLWCASLILLNAMFWAMRHVHSVSMIICPGLPNHSGYLKEGTFKVTSNLSNSRYALKCWWVYHSFLLNQYAMIDTQTMVYQSYRPNACTWDADEDASFSLWNEANPCETSEQNEPWEVDRI